MPSESYLITGATRGIGLALVEEILSSKPDAFVVATGRDLKAASSLQELSKKYEDRLALVKLDVSDAASVQKAVEEVTPFLPNGLDYLVLNASVHHQPACTFDDMSYKQFIFSSTTHSLNAKTHHFLCLPWPSVILRG